MSVFSTRSYSFAIKYDVNTDKHTANVRHLMQDEGDPLGGSDKQMKKKKKRKREDDMVAMNSLMFKSDPNEPVYCYCRQVSYGEMVGCDNPECPIEWFHFECVGLTETVSILRMHRLYIHCRFSLFTTPLLVMCVA